MLFGPLIIAIIIGVLVVSLTLLMKKVTSVKLLVFTPTILAFLTSVYLMYLGYVKVRGFEGGAYMILSLLVFIISLTSAYFARKKVD